MSVLAATTLRERASAKDVPVETVRQGTPKAVLNLKGDGTVVNYSLGVSSTTDTGAGRAGYSLTVPFLSAAAHVPTVAPCGDVVPPGLAGAFSVLAAGGTLYFNSISQTATDPSLYWLAAAGAQT